MLLDGVVFDDAEVEGMRVSASTRVVTIVMNNSAMNSSLFFLNTSLSSSSNGSVEGWRDGSSVETGRGGIGTDRRGSIEPSGVMKIVYIRRQGRQLRARVYILDHTPLTFKSNGSSCKFRLSKTVGSSDFVLLLGRV